MKTALAYLRLYRIDAFIVTFLSFLVPVTILTGELSFSNVLIALLVSGLSVNSAYTLNSWFDRAIDAVNKPHRPIPAAIISPRNALIYALLLIVVSMVYPFLLGIPLQAALIIFSITVFGILYSNPWVPFKKNMLTAVFTTSYILVSPAAAGLAIHGLLDQGIHIIVYLFCYCFAVIPLKDIEDVEGDVLHRSHNWSARLGDRKLVGVSLLVLALLSVSTHFFIMEPKMSLALMLFALDTLVFIFLYSVFFKNRMNKLYRSLIIFDILQGALGLLFYNCLQI